ncbi:MAG: hypothetical protein SO146_04380 [Eubacteriales bacterium]|nr:hypothetical protein [Eubacteriales bacterium]
MTNYLKIDLMAERIIMDRTFAKTASIVGSTNYNLLQEARRDYPGYGVITRSIRKKEDKECYACHMQADSSCRR